MKKTTIETGTPLKSYGSFEAATSGAKRHPMQDRALSDSKLLEHAQVVAARWFTEACEISFTNGRILRVEASNHEISWSIRTAEMSHEVVQFEPIELHWKSGSTSVFDPYSMISQIAQSEFEKLFVNEVGLLLYTRGNSILWFSAHRVSGADQDFLTAFFE